MYDESRFPLNRVIAFFGPYISIAAGALASWLLVHVHVLGLFHVQHDGLSTAIAQGSVFLLTALLAWAGHSKWLTGHQILLQQGVAAAGPVPAADVLPAAGALPAALPEPVFDDGPEPAGALPPGPDDVHPEPGDAERLQAAAVAPVPVLAPPPPPPLDDLPTDEEEFARPPDAYTYDDGPESRFRPDPPEDV